ncbi:hypothetical protein FHS95_002343 [Sphingomonas naasensis]|uniref:DUF2155 domain-containing protein n=1 Tax=Sphingomonas naasensis TaxID=1344951 RepID=A0A4S1W444_9SPHN|nr:hypothetical protein [Sphingomonas naasensis]TGX37624.1 DUF2155 domain-containing protein [Sphingomonas naasensis]
MTRRAAIAAAAALLLATGACKGGEEAGNNAADDLVITTGPGNTAGGTEVVAVGPDTSVLNAAATPMKEREAVLGLLNKRNGQAREFKLKPGQAGRSGDVIVRLRACDKTAPWEAEQLTGAFLQVDVEQLDKSWRRVFSGWVYKERPALNVVQHPIYDVWIKSCAMTFRDSGPDTVPAPAAGGSGSGDRSSAKKSPETEGAPSESPAAESPSAAPSNAT